MIIIIIILVIKSATVHPFLVLCALFKRYLDITYAYNSKCVVVSNI